MSITLPAIIITPVMVKIIYFAADFSSSQLKNLISITRIGFIFLVPQALVSLFSTIFASSRMQKISAPVGMLLIIILNLFSYIASKNNSLEQIMLSYGFSFFGGSLILYYLLNKYVDKKIHKSLIYKLFN